MSTSEVPCDRTMIVVADGVIGLGVGCSDEHGPREVVAMDPAEARRLAGALLDAAGYVTTVPRARRGARR